MRNATLLFLIKRSADKKVSEICLAMKKRGFGMGRWNGVGGKCDPGESIEDATIRETFEEIGVKISNNNIEGMSDLKKMAELEFTFADPGKSDWNQLVHVYFCEKWEGEPVESEEMNPKWFKVSEIPFDQMWPDDKYWLPHVLDDKKVKANKVKASFTFGDGDVVLKQKVEIVP